MRLPRTWAGTGGAGLALLLVAGCGGTTPPAESVPELSARLSAVDRALADHEFARARRQVTRLVRATLTARESGQLEAAQAEPILTAAENLLTTLPRPEQRRQQPAPPPSPHPPAPQPEPTADQEASEERQEELKKRREELHKEREKRQEEREKRLEKQREERQKRLEKLREKQEGKGHGHDQGHGD